jgi:hypothetical protein
MNTIRARYEVGIGDMSLEHFRLWSDASTRAVAIGGYVYDRMARVGKPQLWQAINGDLIVQSVRLPNTVCTPTDCGLPASDSLSTPAAISG